MRKILDHGDILQLKNWILHHYVGDEGFFGWLALQPYEHRESLSCLSDDEGKEFGELLKAIEKGLRKYWEKKFPKDTLERVYVTCFYESSEHLHLHIVPRPKSFKKDLHLCTKTCSGFEEIDKTSRSPYGWHIYLASKCYQFPKRYQKDKQKTKELMKYLKKEISSCLK